MVNSEDIIIKIYNFFREENKIPLFEDINNKGNMLFSKFDELKNKGILSDKDYNEIEKLYDDALLINEFSSFITGFYIARKINEELDFYIK